MPKNPYTFTPDELFEAYQAIEDYVLEHGLFPSLAHLAQALGFVANSAAYYRLIALVDAGYVETVKKGGGQHVTYRLPEHEFNRLLQLRGKRPADSLDDTGPRLRLYNYLIASVLNTGLFPSVGVIRSELGYSNNSAIYYHLNKLVGEGQLEKVGMQYKLPDVLLVDIYSQRIAAKGQANHAHA